MQNRTEKNRLVCRHRYRRTQENKAMVEGSRNGSSVGGIFVFTANIYGTQEITVPPALRPEVNDKGMGKRSGLAHAWQSSVITTALHYDLNGDGNFSDNMDISTEAGAKSTDAQ